MRASVAWLAVIGLMGSAPNVQAQARGRAGGGPPQTARVAAPIDLSGYWVSVVTEDWRYRMVTPAKGDYQGIPMTPAAVKAADSWDPDADTAAGLQCKSYGAGIIMRVPGRLRIAWHDDETLRIETDAGTQTRVLRFAPGAAASTGRSWQGDSAAQWQMPRGSRGRAGASPSPPRNGSLKVVTTNLRAGYLRKNGVPYSERATITEHFDVAPLPDGGRLLLVTTIIEDPVYLNAPYVVSPHFKKEADGSKWDPSPCSSTW